VHYPAVATSRGREIWRHRESGDAYLVELEDDRVLAANGPVAEDELEEAAIAWKDASLGRSPGYTAEAADLERRRDEFAPEPLDRP
jgi:hypothetical protein